MRLIARDLGVRHVLEGSARRAAGRVRINAQLIDAIAGDHIWAERYDRSLEDIFAVQDEVTGKIVEALVGRLAGQPARNRPTTWKPMTSVCEPAPSVFKRGSPRRKRIFLEQAIGLDPEYAEAHRWLALNLWLGWVFWNEPKETNRARSRKHSARLNSTLTMPGTAGGWA